MLLDAPTTTGRALLRPGDLSADDLRALLDLAAELKRDSRTWTHVLAGETVAFLADPTGPPPVPLAVAGYRLGAQVVPFELGLSGEAGEDSARLLSRLTAAVAVRTPDARGLASLLAADVPVLNALSDEHDPLGALGDLLTLRERFGRLRHLRVVYVGDGATSSCHSLLEAGALAGLHLAVTCPEGFEPRPEVLELARALARAQGGTVTVTRDPSATATNAHAVLTAASARWGDGLSAHRVTAALMDRSCPGAAFLHALPARRGQEVEAEVIDGPQSAVWDQPESRVLVTQAALCGLVRGDWTPPRADAGQTPG